MDGMTGLELQDKLIERQSPLPIVFITGHGDVPMAVDTMKKGALDFIQKPFDESALVSVVERMLEHARTAFTDQQQAATREALLAKLTGRESQVLERIVAGRLNKQIADDLGISIKTVEAHRANIMEKLGANTVADLLKSCPGLGSTAAKVPGIEPAASLPQTACASACKGLAAFLLLSHCTYLFPTTMTAQIIDGKALSAQLRTEVAQRAAALTAQGHQAGSGGGVGGRQPGHPGLCAQQGARPAKTRAFTRCLEKYDASMTEAELLARVGSAEQRPQHPRHPGATAPAQAH